MDTVIKIAKGELKKLGFGYIKLKMVIREGSSTFILGSYPQELIVVSSSRSCTKEDKKFCEKKYGSLIHSFLRIDELNALKKVFGKYPYFGLYPIDNEGYYYE